MTGNSKEYVQFVTDKLAPLGDVQVGRFFGGVGLAQGGVQFAMLMGNSLYFVVDDQSRPRYERMGSAPFSYLTKKGRVEVKRYYEVPGDVLEDEEQLLALARESVATARIGAARKKTAKRR